MTASANHTGESMVPENTVTISNTPQKLGSMLSVLLAPFAKRFIAGTKLTEALDAVAKLKSKGFSTTLDHLGEDVASVSEAKISAEQYTIMLRALKEKGLERNVSVKLTQIGLAIDPELCLENLNRIVAAAEGMGGFVRVDMEGSALTQATLDVVMRAKKNRATPVGTVLQAMLKRTPRDMIGLMEKDTTVRLCKGAYKEPAEIAYKDMRDIRKQYSALAKRLITSTGFHGIATHDKILIEEIKQFARLQKINPDGFEFQMLLGVRPKLQKQIVEEGWRLRVYVPFGRAWVPYTWRRLRERKENVWFVLESLIMS